MNEKISATKSKINSLFDEYLKQEKEKKEDVRVKEEEEEEETPAKEHVDKPVEEEKLKEEEHDEELKEEEHDDEIQPSGKEIDDDLMDAIEEFYADKFQAKEILKKEEEEEEEMSKEQPKEEAKQTEPEVKTTPASPPLPPFPTREEPGFINFKNQDDFEKFVSFIVGLGNNQAEKRFRPRESSDNDEGEMIARPEKIRRLETIPFDPFL